MKKTFYFIFILICLLFLWSGCMKESLIQVDLTKNVSKQILSQTVKVVAYNLTKGNQVIEKQIGSGTLVSQDGIVFTNHHVVIDEFEEPYEAFAICVVTNKQKKPDCLYTASLTASDKNLDMAILKINPLDVYQKQIPSFPYLPYRADINLEEGDRISAIGFPVIGGETVTATEGQVSGYEEASGIKRIKIDATIDPGSSGGTMLDKKDRFVGIPTYLRSQHATIGYVIPLSEASEFIEKNIFKDPQQDDFTDQILCDLLKITFETDHNREYVSNLFPYYKVEIPEPWKISFLSNVVLALENKIEGKQVTITFSKGIGSYKLDDDFLQYMLKKIEKNKHALKNYSQKEFNLNGILGYLIQYEEGENQNNFFIGFKENASFSVNYNIPLENFDEAKTAIDKILESFQILEEENTTMQYTKEYVQKRPDIKIQTFDSFYVLPAYESHYENTIMFIENEDNFEQRFVFFEENLPNDYRKMDKEAIMEEMLKNYSDYNLINKYDSVTIDGLDGFAFTYTYKGDDYVETIKKTEIILLNGDKYFDITYLDLEEEYETNIESVIKILETFEYQESPERTSKGIYDIPPFGINVIDLRNHLDEFEINALINQKIIETDGNYFFPEEKMKLGEALIAAIKSKIFIEKGRNISTTSGEIDEISSSNSRESFFTYAANKGIIDSLSRFNPEELLSVSQALEILCKVYELPVWDPPYKEKIKPEVPYLQKGYWLGLMYSHYKGDYTLKRGEFAEMLYRFIQKVGERDDF